jgi:hypothetical protein
LVGRLKISQNHKNKLVKNELTCENGRLGRFLRFGSDKEPVSLS